MRIYMVLVLLSAMMSSPIFAGEKPTSKIPKAVKNTVEDLFGKGAAKTVTRSPVKGLYEVVVGNEDVLYISKNGRYIIAGSLFEAKTRKNLTDERRTQLREAANPMRIKKINAVDETEMVIFAPENEIKHTINVFTDVDCHFCAKFHQEVPELQKKGVKVRYLAFPRAGVNSGTYKTMVSVWCAKNKQQAMTDAKARRKVKPATCKNPVAAQLELGQSIGITGTPAMVLSNGELVPGYVAASKLVPLLNEKFP